MVFTQATPLVVQPKADRLGRMVAPWRSKLRKGQSSLRWICFKLWGHLLNGPVVTFADSCGELFAKG
jgi:hypothetical protein